MVDTRPLRIALLTPGFPADAQDSGCIPALQDYVRGLTTRHPDWDISVFAQHYPHTRRPYHWQGVRVLPMGGGNRGWPVSLLGRRRLLSALRETGPFDLLHAFWLGDGAGVAATHAYRTGVPLIITLMGQEVRRPNRWYRLMHQPDVVTVAVSDYQRGVLVEQGGPALDRVIPWGVDAAAISSPHRDIHVLGVGNLIPVKDPLAFVRIAARLLPQVPGLRACWAGGGVMEGPARELAQALGIDGHLSFTGPLPRADVLSLMARARVLLHTAEFESFAMVMAEARAQGATVVSRPVGIAATATGPGFRAAGTEAGLAEAALAALSAPPVPPTCPWPLDQAVDAYARLYRELRP